MVEGPEEFFKWTFLGKKASNKNHLIFRQENTRARDLSPHPPPPPPHPNKTAPVRLCRVVNILGAVGAGGAVVPLVTFQGV